MSSNVFVYTLSRTGEVGAWSRFTFPFDIDNFARSGDDMYIRAGDDILMYDKNANFDYNNNLLVTPFSGTVQWPWLDLGTPGANKILDGVDIVSDASSSPTVSIGYREGNPLAYTTPYTVGADTIRGAMIPLTMMAPSFSFKAVYPGTGWVLHEANMYFREMRQTAGP